MLQYKQPKKVKGTRKKAREEISERLQLRYPTWFYDKTEKEIKELVSAFRSTGKSDDDFPIFCVEYESKIKN